MTSWSRPRPPGPSVPPSNRAYDHSSSDPSGSSGRLDIDPPSGCVWDGSGWVKAHPAQKPPACQYMGMTYDGASGQIVLFGGFGNNGPAAPPRPRTAPAES